MFGILSPAESYVEVGSQLPSWEGIFCTKWSVWNVQNFAVDPERELSSWTTGWKSGTSDFHSRYRRGPSLTCTVPTPPLKPTQPPHCRVQGAVLGGRLSKTWQKQTHLVPWFKPQCRQLATQKVAIWTVALKSEGERIVMVGGSRVRILSWTRNFL
jgi:hypothetical protein